MRDERRREFESLDRNDSKQVGRNRADMTRTGGCGCCARHTWGMKPRAAAGLDLHDGTRKHFRWQRHAKNRNGYKSHSNQPYA